MAVGCERLKHQGEIMRSLPITAEDKALNIRKGPENLD
jgi:hypothetical protein